MYSTVCVVKALTTEPVRRGIVITSSVNRLIRVHSDCGTFGEHSGAIVCVCNGLCNRLKHVFKYVRKVMTQICVMIWIMICVGVIVCASSQALVRQRLADAMQNEFSLTPCSSFFPLACRSERMLHNGCLCRVWSATQLDLYASGVVHLWLCPVLLTPAQAKEGC